MNIPESSAQKYKKKKETGEVVFNFDKQTVPINVKALPDSNIEDSIRSKENSSSNSSTKVIGILVVLFIGFAILWKKKQYQLNDFITHSDTVYLEPDTDTQPIPFMISKHLQVDSVHLPIPEKASNQLATHHNMKNQTKERNLAPLWLQRPRSL